MYSAQMEARAQLVWLLQGIELHLVEVLAAAVTAPWKQH